MICKVKDINIYYESYGEGTPILMIHGWGPDHRLMKGCMEPIFQKADTKWKRIYFDLPGMGKTKGESWITGADHMLELVLGFIDAIIPNQVFVLVGESYGGFLSRAIINKRASLIDGLLLICPAAGESGARFQVIENDEEFVRGLSKEDRDYFEMEGVNAVRNKKVWERFKEEVIPGLKIADYAFLNNCRNPIGFDVDALEKPFMKPTLLLAGRQDSMVGYRGLWNLIELYPRASFVLLDKAAHGMQIEQDVLFTGLVKEWLNRVSADRD